MENAVTLTAVDIRAVLSCHRGPHHSITRRMGKAPACPSIARNSATLQITTMLELLNIESAKQNGPNFLTAQVQLFPMFSSCHHLMGTAPPLPILRFPTNRLFPASDDAYPTCCVAGLIEIKILLPGTLPGFIVSFPFIIAGNVLFVAIVQDYFQNLCAVSLHPFLAHSFDGPQLHPISR